MMDFVCRNASLCDVLERVVAVHCDLGKVEWQGTKELAEEHCKHYGIPLHVVRREKGDLLQQVRERGMWPDNKNRYCTSDQKRDQVAKLITYSVNDFIAGHFSGIQSRAVQVLNCMGIRADESPARAKKLAFQINKRASNGKRLVHDWFPIFNWSVGEVWGAIKSSGIKYHYAYDRGMPRLSCCFCVFASPAALMIAGKHNPELLAEYVEVEKSIGHTFRNGFKIASIKERLDAGELPPVKAPSWAM